MTRRLKDRWCLARHRRYQQTTVLELHPLFHPVIVERRLWCHYCEHWFPFDQWGHVIPHSLPPIPTR